MKDLHIFSNWRAVLVSAAIGVAAIASADVFAQTVKRGSTAPVTVRAVTRTPLPRGERITIELSGEVRYTTDRVPNPDRVYFDFQNSRVASSVVAAARGIPPGTLVSGVRLGQFTPEATRLVLDLTGRPRYSAFPMYGPFRLVIDVETDPTSGAAPEAPAPVSKPATATPANAEAAPAPPPAPPPAPLPAPLPVQTAAVPALSESAYVPPAPAVTPPALSTPPPPATPVSSVQTIVSKMAKPPAPAAVLSRGHDYSLARQLGLGIARVVIDAGHGGHDPGAHGVGVVEAELVLDVALRLEKILKEQQGVEVVLTRRTDEFIPLEERTAIANREGADLFLSIHANASTRPTARGIETYFLNFATDPEAEAVAARENATSGRNMGKLPDLVKTIALNNKVVESRELATVVQQAMARNMRVQNKTLRDLGVKQAPFVVLIGAEMPSILAEISFVTNKTEASLLKQASYRQRIAQSLANGVLRYQSSLKRTPTMAVKVQGR